jgi:hypothetical protein
MTRRPDAKNGRILKSLSYEWRDRSGVSSFALEGWQIVASTSGNSSRLALNAAVEAIVTVFAFQTTESLTGGERRTWAIDLLVRRANDACDPYRRSFRL